VCEWGEKGKIGPPEGRKREFCEGGGGRCMHLIRGFTHGEGRGWGRGRGRKVPWGGRGHSGEGTSFT